MVVSQFLPRLPDKLGGLLRDPGSGGFTEVSLDVGRPGPTNLADSWSDYVLATNVTGSSPSSYLLAYCKPCNHRGGTYVVFIDNSTIWVKTNDFAKLGCDIVNMSKVVTGPATLKSD